MPLVAYLIVLLCFSTNIAACVARAVTQWVGAVLGSLSLLLSSLLVLTKDPSRQTKNARGSVSWLPQDSGTLVRASIMHRFRRVWILTLGSGGDGVAREGYGIA